MRRRTWVKIRAEDRANYTYKQVGKYYLIIGIPRGGKLFEYVAGNSVRSHALLLMQSMMRQGCKYYRMEIQPCDNTQGAIDDVLHRANRGRE